MVAGIRRVGAAGLLAVALVGCSSSSKTPAKARPSTTTSGTQPTTSVSTPQSGSVSTTGAGNATQPQNLTTTDAVRAALVAAFAAGLHIDRSYVSGTVAGSVYYAYVPATHTYWALAEYAPSNAALQAHNRLDGTPDDPLVKFQGSPFVLSRIDGSGWKLVKDTGGLVCPPRPPASVLALWSVGGGSDCPR